MCKLCKFVSFYLQKNIQIYPILSLLICGEVA